jgi:hypothetical protein
MIDIILIIGASICYSFAILSLMFFAMYRVMRYTAQNVSGEITEIVIEGNKKKIFIKGQYQDFIVTLDVNDVL